VLSRLAYVLRETGASLRRNLTLTLASLLTVGVSLALVGFSLLVQSGAGNLLYQWRNGVELIVFMTPDAKPDQLDAVKAALAPGENALVKSYRFVDKPEALEEIKRLFPDNPGLLETSSTDIVPTSFRVVPKSADDSVINALTNQFRTLPGVSSVQSAKDAVAFVRTVSGFLRYGSYWGAAFLGISALMLIWNTIRTAMFARRREIEVMKLVGATNWFIRWPFVLEGMVQGLVGSLIACSVVWLGKSLWKSKVIDPVQSAQFKLNTLQATYGQFVGTCKWLLLFGVLAGAVASAVAATRFLDV
jgi:cell division transport system permease protein